MTSYYWNVRDTLDFEERLEDAAMMYALREAGLAITPIDTAPPEDGVTFGARQRFENPKLRSVDRYWECPAIADHMRRKFEVCGLSRATELHREWGGVFLKHTRAKRGIWRVPKTAEINKILGADAYELCYDDPVLLTQELVEINDETRFFIVAGEVVTASPTKPHLTPLCRDYISQPLFRLAEKLAPKLPWSHVGLDLAYINEEPGVVEVNPAIPGRIGLYGCDVMKLALRLYRSGCLEHYQPTQESRPAFLD